MDVFTVMMTVRVLATLEYIYFLIRLSNESEFDLFIERMKKEEISIIISKYIYIWIFGIFIIYLQFLIEMVTMQFPLNEILLYSMAFSIESAYVSVYIFFTMKHI